MGSTRLPGKSMMPVYGKPLVFRILERLKRCANVDEIVLAIPDTEPNKPLALVAGELGVECYSGSEDDVLRRYYDAGVKFGADLVVRIPADNATPEPFEIDKVIAYHKSLGRAGFTSNLAEIFESGYPDGIGAEVFDFQFLDHLMQCPEKILSREHVHLNFFNYSTGEVVDAARCPVTTMVCPEEYRRPDIVLDVNTVDQYKYICALYESLYPRNPSFSIFDILVWHDEARSRAMNSI
jgi:spore coat polysaccharide biosynthesis protein SpsF